MDSPEANDRINRLLVDTQCSASTTHCCEGEKLSCTVKIVWWPSAGQILSFPKAMYEKTCSSWDDVVADCETWIKDNTDKLGKKH